MKKSFAAFISYEASPKSTNAFTIRLGLELFSLFSGYFDHLFFPGEVYLGSTAEKIKSVLHGFVCLPLTSEEYDKRLLSGHEYDRTHPMDEKKAKTNNDARDSGNFLI